MTVDQITAKETQEAQKPPKTPKRWKTGLANFKNSLKLFFKRLWKRKFILLTFIAVTILICFLLKSTFSTLQITNITLITVGEIILVGLYNENWHRNAFCTILIIGIAFSIISPIYDIPDEDAHFARTLYQSSGNFILSKNTDDYKISKSDQYIERNLGDIHKAEKRIKISDTLNIPFDSNTYVGNNVSRTWSYSFLSYMPQTLGIWVGRALHLPFGIIFLIGRLFNLLVYAVIICLSIKISPYLKEFLYVVACMPMSVYLASSYNQDALFISISLLIIAYFIRLLSKPEGSIGIKDMAVFIGLCSLMIVIKLPYVLLVGLSLFIPIKKFKHKRNYFYSFIGIILLAGLTFLWFKYANSFAVANSVKETTSQQTQYALTHIPRTIKTIAATILFNMGEIKTMFYFGWLSYKIAYVGICFFVFYIALFILFPAKSKLGGWAPKVGSVLVFGAIYFIVYLSMFITWTSVGAHRVAGVQGRYLLPLLTLLPIIFAARKKPVFSEKAKKNLSLAVQCISLCFLQILGVVTVLRYY